MLLFQPVVECNENKEFVSHVLSNSYISKTSFKIRLLCRDGTHYVCILIVLSNTEKCVVTEKLPTVILRALIIIFIIKINNNFKKQNSAVITANEITHSYKISRENGVSMRMSILTSLILSAVKGTVSSLSNQITITLSHTIVRPSLSCHNVCNLYYVLTS